MKRTKPEDQDRIDALRFLGRELVACHQRRSQIKAALRCSMRFVCEATIEVHDGDVILEASAHTRSEAVRRTCAKVAAQFGANKASSLKSIRVLAMWDNGVWVEVSSWSEAASRKMNVSEMCRALPTMIDVPLSFAERLRIGRAAYRRGTGCGSDSYSSFASAVLRAVVVFCRTEKVSIYEWTSRLLGRR